MSYLKKAVTRITLDLSMPDVQKSITCTRGDRNRLVEIVVTNEGKPFQLPPGWSAMLTGTKPDDTELVNGCVVENGYIVYDFESGDQIATCAGRYAVTVWIYDEEGVPVAAPKIWVNVIESGAQQIVESSDQFNVLLQQEAEILALQLKDTQVDEELKTLSSRLGNVVSSRVITIDPSQWTDASPYEAGVDVFMPPGTVKKSTFLLIPKDMETRYESQRIELAVEAVAGDDNFYFRIVFVRQDTDPPTIPLQYLALVVYDENAPEGFTATAEFVGVVNLPDELMEREVKRALEVLGVDEELKTLSSRLGNVVSSRVITIDPSQWTDSAPLDASINIYVPGGTERRSTVLLIPKNKATRDESQRIELAVTTHWTTDQVMSIMILMKRQDTDPPTIPLSYLALVVYDEEAADDSTSTAEFVGVVNLPDELMEREVKRALEVLGVTYDTPTSIDLSRMDEGEIVETFAGGSTKTTTIEYDADGNPVKITDGDGNETVLTW